MWSSSMPALTISFCTSASPRGTCSTGLPLPNLGADRMFRRRADEAEVTTDGRVEVDESPIRQLACHIRGHRNPFRGVELASVFSGVDRRFTEEPLRHAGVARCLCRLCE